MSASGRANAGGGSHLYNFSVHHVHMLRPRARSGATLPAARKGVGRCQSPCSDYAAHRTPPPPCLRRLQHNICLPCSCIKLHCAFIINNFEGVDLCAHESRSMRLPAATMTAHAKQPTIGGRRQPGQMLSWLAYCAWQRVDQQLSAQLHMNCFC